jgi:RNase P/RNase MRP subunit p29
MKIRNLQLRSIEARRFIDRNEKPRQIRIDHNSQVTQIQNKSDNQAVIDFQYTASYGAVGMIKIEGSLLYENPDAKRIAKEWIDKRKMPDQTAGQIHTAVMHSCVPEAVGIAKDLGLPPPIPLPQVRLGVNTKKGQAGPEIA